MESRWDHDAHLQRHAQLPVVLRVPHRRVCAHGSGREPEHGPARWPVGLPLRQLRWHGIDRRVIEDAALIEVRLLFGAESGERFNWEVAHP